MTAAYLVENNNTKSLVFKWPDNFALKNTVFGVALVSSAVHSEKQTNKIVFQLLIIIA